MDVTTLQDAIEQIRDMQRQRERVRQNNYLISIDDTLAIWRFLVRQGFTVVRANSCLRVYLDGMFILDIYVDKTRRFAKAGYITVIPIVDWGELWPNRSEILNSFKNRYTP